MRRLCNYPSGEAVHIAYTAEGGTYHSDKTEVNDVEKWIVESEAMVWCVRCLHSCDRNVQRGDMGDSMKSANLEETRPHFIISRRSRRIVHGDKHAVPSVGLFGTVGCQLDRPSYPSRIPMQALSQLAMVACLDPCRRTPRTQD